MKYILSKITIVMIMFIFVISFTSANLGTIAQNECMNIRVLANCSSVNLSEVSNKEETFVINQPMTNIGGQTFNYSFCNTSTIGTYTFSWDNTCVDCSTYNCGNSFEVTYDGNLLRIENSILYLGLIFILIFLFLLIILNISKLPSGDTYNEEGILLGVNNLKYLRPVLWAVSWGLLIGIMFITSNISIAYLPTEMFGEFFFMIFRVMFILTLPMTVIWFLFIFAKLFRDREMKTMIERGVEIRGKP